jgi:hypothetical protein
VTLPERDLEPEAAEDWIRDLLGREPLGAELTVSGTCMEPALPEGSKVRLKAATGPVRTGDIVLLRVAAGLRLHRVVLSFRGWIRTKGDRGIYLDPKAARQAVIAVCDANEARLTRVCRTAVSVGRLLGRPFAAPERGDGAHARFLP